MKMILPMLLALTIISCSNKEELKKLDNNHPKVIYIEEHSKGGGVYGGEFGDVVVIDLKTKEKIKVTDDDYIDESPCFSPNGKYIAFFTSRGGRYLSRQIQRLGAPHELCIFNIKTQKYRVIDINRKFKNTLDSDQFSKLKYSPDSRSLYFSGVTPYIYKYMLPEDSLTVVHKLADSMDVEKILFLPGQNNLLIYSISSNYSVGKIEQFDKNEKLVKKTIVGRLYKGGNWTDKDKLLLFNPEGGIFEYDISMNTMTQITYKNEAPSFPRYYCYYINNSLVGFVKRSNESYITEIVQYDFKKKAFEKITDDSRSKKDLEINYQD
jgi:hypothetical protein